VCVNAGGGGVLYFLSFAFIPVLSPGVFSRLAPRSFSVAGIFHFLVLQFGQVFGNLPNFIKLE